MSDDEGSSNTSHSLNPSAAGGFVAARETLVEYLDSFADGSSVAKRGVCSHCSAVNQFLYCTYCYHLLPVPPSGSSLEWPESVRQGTFRLPFQSLDIITVDEQRYHKANATGGQVVSILQSTAKQSAIHSKKPRRDHSTSDACIEDNCLHPGTADGRSPCTAVKLIEQEHEIPDYDPSDDTYLLFPGPSSCPLSSILSSSLDPPIKKLVALDCTWSKTRLRNHPSLARLTQVHLDLYVSPTATSSSSPDLPGIDSLYWRWHNAGSGMLSTIEAIYYAAWQVAERCWSPSQQRQLVDLFWVFAQQRQVIRCKYAADQGRTLPPQLPFTQEAKEYQRNLRRKHVNYKSKKSLEKEASS